MKPIDLAIGMFVCVTIGAGLGILLFVRMTPDNTVAFQASSFAELTPTPVATAPLPTQQAAPATPVPPPTPGAVGSSGYFTRSGGEYPYRLVWVNRTGMWAFDRAYDERDDRQMSRVLELYETLRVDDGTMVQIVNRDSEAIQVEMRDGPHSGRRGWLVLARGDLSTTPTVPTAPTPRPLVFTPGEAAYIRYGGSPVWWIPVNRPTYTTWERSGFQEPSPPGLDWILTAGGTPVRLIEVDGGAVMVEMTDGTYKGKRAWVPRSMLTNTPR